jgi:5'-3' exonuclease
MLVGNDFLPHSPHLEIDNGAISIMLTNYIDLLPEWGGYLTDREKIHPKRFEQFLYNVAVYEEEHFKRRGFEENEPGWKLNTDNEQDKNDFYGTYFSGNPTPAAAFGATVKGKEPPPSKVDKSTAEEGADGDVDTVVSGPVGNRDFRRSHAGSKARSYRDFYYESKMGWPVEDRDRTLFQRRAHVRDYMEGLHWCLNYYHNGCQAWDWYFPHMYSPLSSDIVNLNEFYDESEDSEFKSFPFDKGTPFPSLAQLLSVLPPQSASLLPKALAELMLHPSSPLIPYYPSDFTSDPNGKRQSWEAIVLIPFIDADQLLDTVERVLDKDKETGALLSAAERRRNAPGKSHVFVPPGGGEGANGGNGAPKKTAASKASRAKGSTGSRQTVAATGSRKAPSPKGSKKKAVKKE